jgi:hypothetical protein
MLAYSILARTGADWAYGLWKGECSGRDSGGYDPTGARLLEGVAEIPGIPPAYTNAILCTNSDEMNGRGWTLDKFNYVVLNVDSQNDQRGSWQIHGDWAEYRYKGLCPDGYAVTGLAQTPSNVSAVKRVLCSKISLARPQQCWTVGAFIGDYGDDWGKSVGDEYGVYDFYGQDWNYGHWKASCPADTYVAGVGVYNFSHTADTLLCCY